MLLGSGLWSPDSESSSLGLQLGLQMKHLGTSYVLHVHIKRSTKWKAQSPLEALDWAGPLPMSAIIFLDTWLASFSNIGRVYVLWIACSLLQAFFSFVGLLAKQVQRIITVTSCNVCKTKLNMTQFRTRGVSHSGLATYIKKYLIAKEISRKLKYFIMQSIIIQKSSRRN